MKEKIYERENINQLVKKLEKYDIVSFDIFDTLILRPFKTPTDLFKLLSPYYNIVNFSSIRINAQATSRKKKKEKFGHTEVTIKDIYNELNLQTGISVEEGVKKEFELEKEFCYANPYMLKIYNELLKLKKKIIIVSDMYFPSDYIVKILNKCGYKNYDKLYISCDYSATKYNGDLFEIINKDYPNNGIIHVGDNLRSDINNPKKYGWDTYHYLKISNVSFYTDSFNMAPTIKSYYTGIIKNTLFNGINTKINENIYYKYGFIHSGLIILGYVNWIHDFAIKNKINKILFLSRDGFILKKVYDKLFKDIESEYVLWSRHATLKVSPEKDLKRFIWQFITRPIEYNNGEICVKEILEKSNLLFFEEKLMKYNIRLDDKVNKNIKNILIKLAEENRDVILENNLNIKNAAKKYYSEKIKGFNNICIVDIGYRGSGAIALKELFKEWNFKCNVNTLIAYGLSKRLTFDDTFVLDKDINAYVFNDLFNYDLSRDYLKHQLLNTALIDILVASAPCPSFLYFYLDKNNKILFKFEDKENYDKIQKIHEGILDFIDIYISNMHQKKLLLNISGHDAHEPINYLFKEENYEIFAKDFADFPYSVMISGLGNKTDNFYNTYNYIKKKEKKPAQKSLNINLKNLIRKKIVKNKYYIFIKKCYKRFIKIIKTPSIRCRFIYTKYYENKKIKKDVVLLQSYGGDNFSGNVYYILKELKLSKKYGDYKFFIGIKEDAFKMTKKLLKNNNIRNVKLLLLHSRKYCKILATAKYLINNVGFPEYFIKKENQIFINTWHGTPLKGLGKSIKDAPHESGNYQRNFLMTNYFIHPNYYTYNIIMNDYMISNIYRGENLISGYPRNSIFYDINQRKQLRKKLNVEEKKVIVYMPTWRRGSTRKKNNNQYDNIEKLLSLLNEKINDDTIVYVKLHNLVKEKINIEKFNKIHIFPSDYETYEILNIADCLITDYSSVFFDFANTRKKIILYAYDKDEYMNGRSVYFPLEDLPFPIIQNEEDLLNELRDLEHFEPYDDFIKKYCYKDSLDTTKKLCEYIFLRKNNLYKPIKQSVNKDNILLFAGSLKNNYITCNLFDILNNINATDKIYLCFYMKKVLQNKLFINEFSDKFKYITLQGYKDVLIHEALCLFLYNKLNINNKFISKCISNVYKREILRMFPNISFSKVIDVSATSKGITNLFANMEVKEKIIITFQKDFLINKNKKYIKNLKNNFDKITGVYMIEKVDINKNKIKISYITQKKDSLFSKENPLNNLTINLEK